MCVLQMILRHWGISPSSSCCPSTQTMQSHAAVFRTGSVLKEGCDKMDTIYQSMDNIKTFDRGAAHCCLSVYGNLLHNTGSTTSLLSFRYRVEHRPGWNAGAAESDAERRPDHQLRWAEKGEQGSPCQGGLQGQFTIFSLCFYVGLFLLYFIHFLSARDSVNTVFCLGSPRVDLLLSCSCSHLSCDFRTVWTSTTTRSPCRVRRRNPSISTGGNTLCLM